MPFTPPTVSEVVDFAVFEKAVYDALRANQQVTQAVADRIYSGPAPDNTAPYITITLVILPQKIYGGQIVTYLLDATLTTEGRDISQYAAAFKAMQVALVDTNWPIPGYDSHSRLVTGLRPIDTPQGDVVRRGRQLSITGQVRKT